MAAKMVRSIEADCVALNASGGFHAAGLPFGGGKKRSGNNRESLAVVTGEITQMKPAVLRYILKEDRASKEAATLISSPCQMAGYRASTGGRGEDDHK